VHLYVCVKLFTFFDLYFVYFLQYSDTVGWVFWPVKMIGRITYIVLAQTLNHAQSINHFNHWCYRWKTLFMKISTCSQARALILRTCVFCGTTAPKEVSTYVSVLPVVLCIYSLAKYRCMINDKTGLCGPFAKYCSYQKQMFTSVNLRFGSIPYKNQTSDETVSDQQYGNNQIRTTDV